MKPYLPTMMVASALIAMSAGEYVPSANAQHKRSQGPADMRPEFDNATMLVLRIRMGHMRRPRCMS